MEEVVQTLTEERVLLGERGNYHLGKAPTELHISPTVQGVLAARIDRLAADEKALLHQLAVIGREFPLSLVRQVVTQPEEELYQLLASLQRKELLYEQPAFPEVEYIFKHALTQEVAYGTVLQERRKALHEQTAQAIEALYWAWGTCMRGWALAKQGQTEEGIAQMRQGIAAWQATGAEVGKPYFLSLLAEMYGKAGQPEQGAALLAEALEIVHKTGERQHEAEVHRLKGQLVLQSGVRRHKSPAPSTQHLAPTRRRKPTPASRGCGSNRRRKPKLTSCYQRFTTGSAKVLTPKTCRRRGNC